MQIFAASSSKSEYNLLISFGTLLERHTPNTSMKLLQHKHQMLVVCTSVFIPLFDAKFRIFYTPNNLFTILKLNV